jgi:hypothetical protein
MDKFWKAALAVGGLAAIGAFVFWSLYKGWLALDIFSRMTPEQTFAIMKLFLALVFASLVVLVGAYILDTRKPGTTPSPPAQPAVENQVNVAGNQYNAQGNITHVEGDLVQGDKVGGDKDVHEAGRDVIHAEHDVIINPPPPPPTPALPLNLRQISEPTKDFVGREGEIETLLAAFDGAGRGAVISGVRGMGGVGKTELACVLAKRLKDRFPDGQIAFNLRGASEDDSSNPATAVEAVQHVLRSFHPDAKLPEDLDQLKGLYHSVLDGKQVLLMMDNARDAGQLAPLTPPPDGCALMVTSRHRFTLAGMAAIDLDTLPPEEARDLLLEICPRIGEHAGALAKRCGYLPLALRLAASGPGDASDARGHGPSRRLGRGAKTARDVGRIQGLDE